MKCKNCGYTLDGDEKFCPNCGSTIRKKRKKWILLLPLLIIVLGVFLGAGYVRNEKLNEVIEISAKELLKEDALEEYKSNPLIVHGYLYSDYDGNYYVVPSENATETTLRIFYDESILNNEVGSGTKITIEGKLDADSHYSMHCTSLKIKEKVERNLEFTDVKQLKDVIATYENLSIKVQGYLMVDDDNHIYLANEDESATIDIPNLDLATVSTYADLHGAMVEVSGIVRKQEDTYVLEYEKLNQNEYTQKINDDEYFSRQFEVWNVAQNPGRFDGKKVMVMGVIGYDLRKLPSGQMALTLDSSLDSSKYIIVEGDEANRLPAMSQVDCYGEIYYDGDEIHLIIESFIVC